MNHTLVIARRVLQQLARDRRLFAVSIIVPLVLIFFLKVFFDSIPGAVHRARYVVPIASIIVHFLAFLLCAIVLVQERTAGTMERMYISGFRRFSIIGGYVIGYLGLATLQAGVVLTEVLLLFNLNYAMQTIASLFLIIWLLAIVSVMLGIFVSTFARREAHVFPFIPLIVLPSVFLSGVLVRFENLPTWAQIVGYCFPVHYANNVIQEVISHGGALSHRWDDMAILVGYATLLLVLASLTLQDVDH